MNEYFFIYKDIDGHWSRATNPAFIAKHQKCRAIKQSNLLSKFNSISQFINKANDYFNDEDAQNFILETDLKEIY